MKNIILIQAPLNLESNPIPNVGTLPPLGLLALATYLEKHMPDISVKVVDSDYLGIDEAERYIKNNKPDLVGIGVQASESYRSALKLAKISKSVGAFVVLGGEQTSLRSRQILKKRPYVDYAVSGQGEQAIEAIVSGKPHGEIPNLTYRILGSIVVNPKSRLKLKYLPIPNRKYVDLNSYAIHFRETLESKLTGFKSFTTIKTQDGCMKAIKNDVCSFCKREDLFLLGVRQPKIFWEEMLYLQDLGVDYVWDVSPSFTSIGPKYIEKLVAAKPKACKIAFRIYARADDLSNYRLVYLLKYLGVENVLVGFDAGNQACLDSSNKTTTIEQNIEAARNLREFEIATYSGFVLGHVAETYQSMQDTLNHAYELKTILGEKLFRTTTCSKLQLYPGTWEYNKFVLANEDLRKQLENEDDINIQHLSEKYFKDYLGIDPEAADEIAEEIRNLSPIRSGKDLKKELYAH